MQAGQAARHGAGVLVAAWGWDLCKTLSSAAKTSGSSCLLHFSLQSSAASWLLVIALQSRTRHSHPFPCSLFLATKLLLSNLVCFSWQQPSWHQIVAPQSYTSKMPPKMLLLNKICNATRVNDSASSTQEIFVPAAGKQQPTALC